MRSYTRFLFPATIFFLVVFYFKNAFLMTFFRDDFFFLNISRAKTIGDIIHFFSPVRTYFYRPLASELFYFVMRDHLFLGKTIVFVVFFIGLFFLYKSIFFCFQKKSLARVSTILYSISFIHVFQLYWFATFQEVAIFTFLTASFYFYLKKRYSISIIFYVLALLSKETAILYVIFLVLFEAFISKRIRKNFSRTRNEMRIVFSLLLIVSLGFYYLYASGLTQSTQLDNYRFQFNPRLILNNTLWYSLWSIGTPSFMPDYMKSIISLPIPSFWQTFTSIEFKLYFSFFLLYVVLFIFSTACFIATTKDKDKRMSIFFILGVSLISFFIFLGPILFFPHRWMVRLMVPLIFISISQAFIFVSFYNAQRLFRTLFFILLSLYIVWNYFGTVVHESASMYILESKIVTNITTLFKTHTSDILKSSSLYFKNGTYSPECVAWGGCSKKIENTLHGTFFLDYYFPNSKKNVYYEWDKPEIPRDAFVINSYELLR